MHWAMRTNCMREQHARYCHKHYSTKPNTHTHTHTHTESETEREGQREREGEIGNRNYAVARRSRRVDLRTHDSTVQTSLNTEQLNQRYIKLIILSSLCIDASEQLTRAIFIYLYNTETPINIIEQQFEHWTPNTGDRHHTLMHQRHYNN